VKIHPICTNCFEKCRAGHHFGYGERCNVCGDPRRRFNLIRYEIDPDDPTFGITSTGSTSYPTTNIGRTSGSAIQNVPNASYVAFTKITLSVPYTLTSFYVSCKVSCNTKAAIYTDSSGKPQDRVAADDTPHACVAGLNNYTPSFCPYFLDTGVYWIAIKSDTNQSVYTYSSGSGYYIAEAYTTAFPASYGSGNVYNDFVVYFVGVQVKGYVKWTKATLSEAGSMTSLSAYFHATGNGRFAIHDDSSGPNVLKWESESTPCSATAWTTVLTTAGTPTSLALAVGTYWLGWQWDSVNSGPSYAAGGSNTGAYLVQAYGAFPNPATGETLTTENWSEYVTYSTADFVNVSDTGAGSDVPTIADTQIYFDISDTGTGVDAPSITDTEFTGVADVGAGVDAVTLYDAEYVAVTDSGLAAEFAWHTKGLTLIDSLELPHVLSIRISDPASISDRPLGGTLPLRRVVDKPGRIVEIMGWTRNQDDIDAMEALADGTVRTFIHPSGDSFAVLISDFDPARSVDKHDRRLYRLQLQETRSW